MSQFSVLRKRCVTWSRLPLLAGVRAHTIGRFHIAVMSRFAASRSLTHSCLTVWLTPIQAFTSLVLGRVSHRQHTPSTRTPPTLPSPLIEHATPLLRLHATTFTRTPLSEEQACSTLGEAQLASTGGSAAGGSVDGGPMKSFIELLTTSETLASTVRVAPTPWPTALAVVSQTA